MCGGQISYWKQFEHGMLSREAVRKLNDLVDIATDIPEGHINIEEIKNCWQLKGFFDNLVRFCGLVRPRKHTVSCQISSCSSGNVLYDIYS